MLFANAKADPKDKRRVLLVLQAMDCGGKDGTVKKVAGTMNPQGLHIVGFGPPTATELRHDFLWRIRRALPKPGHRRGLQPLALRGRAGGAGAQTCPEAGMAQPVPTDK